MYYVYMYLDPRKTQYTLHDGEILEHEPFYVGKGKGKRAWRHLHPSDKTNNSIKKGKIERIVASGHLPKIVLVAENLTEADALKLESEWIARIGTKWNIRDIQKGPLCNMTSGGDGRSPSEEMRKRSSRPGELNPMFGKTHSDEARKKISEQSKKLKHSGETLEKMREARKGGNNYNAKHWEVQLPSGETVVVEDLKAFTKDAKINYNTLYNTLQRKEPVARGNAKGYRLLGPLN